MLPPDMGCENTPPAEVGMKSRRGRIPEKLKVPGSMNKEQDSLHLDVLPRKSGPVMMAAPGGGKTSRKAHVVLSVYCNNYDGYAVVSQDKIMCRDCGYVNMRHCTLLSDPDNNSFQLVPDNREGQSLCFSVHDKRELDSWVSTLQGILDGINGEDGRSISPTTPRSPGRRPLGKLPQRCPSVRRKPILPALEEGSED